MLSAANKPFTLNGVMLRVKAQFLINGTLVIFSITAFHIMKPNIRTFSIITFSIMTFSITTLSIVTYIMTINKTRHSA